MRLGAFIVTFQRPEVLCRTIEAYLSQTVALRRIIVIDNDPDESARAPVLKFGSKVRYVATGANLGPAGGVRRGMAEAQLEDVDAFLWGDDDDPPRSGREIEDLVSSLERAPNSVAGVGVMGAHWRNGRLQALPSTKIGADTEVTYVPGGGLLLMRCSAAASVVGPDACLFFGYEDLDIALKIQDKGMTLSVSAAAYNARYAASGKTQVVRRRRVVPSETADTIWRRYYSVRNYIYLMKQHRDVSSAVAESLRAIVRVIASPIRGARFAFLYAPLMLRAIADGWLGNMGLTVAPKPKHERLAVADRSGQ